MRLHQAMRKPGRGIVHVIANAVECDSYWSTLMTDYMQHLVGMQEHGHKLAVHLKTLATSELNDAGVAAIGEVIAEVHVLKSALRQGACDGLENEALAKSKLFLTSLQTSSSEKPSLKLVDGMQKVLSDAVILWPEDVALAEGVQSLGNQLQKESFAQKLMEVADLCLALFKAKINDIPAVEKAWAAVHEALEEAQLQAAMAVVDSSWRPKLTALVLQTFQFWAKEYLKSEDYQGAGEMMGIIPEAMSKLVPMLDDQELASTLSMFQAAEAVISGLLELWGIGDSYAAIMAADPEMQRVSAVLRSLAKWGRVYQADATWRRAERVTWRCVRRWRSHSAW